MAQISLPDTAVIDLSVIQTIVNAINRLDDAVSNISAAYSVAASDTDPDAPSSQFSSIFNLATHQIQFGRKEVSSTGGTIVFNTPFAVGTKPVFVANVREDQDLTISNYTYALTNEGATVKVKGASSNVYIHWIAIGTRQA